MVIFRYEMKNHLKYILTWAIVIAVCIFSMTPLYYGMMESAASSDHSFYEALASRDFFKSAGMSMNYLSKPLGIYGFLTAFFAIATGIFGLHFGISVHTKECSERTAEYLFTKPCARGEIFRAKAAAVFCGVLIVGLAFSAASLLSLILFRSGFSLREFLLIANSLLLLTLLFAAMGLLIGVLFSNNRSPLLTAGLIVFTEYCITSFSRVVGSEAIGVLSPYSFFNMAEFAQAGFYDGKYLLWYGLLLAVFLLAAHRVFLKKDVRFRS